MDANFSGYNFKESMAPYKGLKSEHSTRVSRLVDEPFISNH
jgi:hypothetical protein